MNGAPFLGDQQFFGIIGMPADGHCRRFETKYHLTFEIVFFAAYFARMIIADGGQVLSGGRLKSHIVDIAGVAVQNLNGVAVFQIRAEHTQTVVGTSCAENGHLRQG